MKWIYRHWSVIGGIGATVIIASIFIVDKELSNLGYVLWLHFAVLLLHQYEEYAFPGKFQIFYNKMIFNKNRITRFPLNRSGIFLVNVLLGWTGYFIASLLGTGAIWLTFGLIGITVLNGVMHTIMFFLLRKYNPGLFTGLFILIPFGLYLFQRLGEFAVIENLLPGLIVFLGGTAMIPTGIYLTNKINLFGWNKIKGGF